MKTIKEAAKEQANNPAIAIQGYRLTAYESFIAGVEFAQQWIDIDEELPEIGQLVLVKNKSGDISTARRGRVKFVIDFFDMRDREITSWRHIELK